MDHLNANTNNQPKEQISLLFLRWIVGGIVGFVCSFFLLITAETVYPPILGPIIAGQQELFYELIFYISFDHFGSVDFIYNLSVFIYSTVWGLIGALIASGRKQQKRIGVILLVIYVVAGAVFMMIWTVLSFSA